VTGAWNARSPAIAVVVPAYRAAGPIARVLARIPPSVSRVVVVDDASPDALPSVLAGIADPRLEVVRNRENLGVGGAVKAGIARALELGAEIVVKLDADGQMDPARIDDLVAPVRDGKADLAKGNRFRDLHLIGRMPLVRRVGNLGLSYLVKLASGYWSLFDPTNGFVALSSELARRLPMERLADRYFFEISLLCEAYLSRAVVREVGMPPVYRDEPSSLSPGRSLLEFLPRLLARTTRRLLLAYFLYDFNAVSLFVATGLPLLLFGTGWSGVHWARSVRTGVVATTGTVMIGTLSIILGFQLLLQAAVLDVQNEPGRRPD
jgi:glycosyltransferase involved in cell wall biosynthesis